MKRGDFFFLQKASKRFLKVIHRKDIRALGAIRTGRQIEREFIETSEA